MIPRRADRQLEMLCLEITSQWQTGYDIWASAAFQNEYPQNKEGMGNQYYIQF
ncbi:MAG: hypothetical protein SH818_06995 [Saprospiraceae bacterium]|nr:hypothetical protein [Saprospiraceae bacterium]